MGPTNYSHRPRQTSIQPDPRLSYRVYLRVGLQAWHYLTPQAILQVNCHLHFTVYLPVHPTVCRHLTKQKSICKTIRDKNRVKKCRKVGVLQACPKACNACGLTSREVCRSSAFKKNSNRCKAVACCKWKKGQCRPKDAKGECFPPYGP